MPAPRSPIEAAFLLPTHWTNKPWHTAEVKTLMTRAEAARQAIRCGADPHLVLSLVVWPTPLVQEAELQRDWRIAA